MTKKICIATFNLENLDVTENRPSLDERIAVMQPQINRINADILCFQEVNGQEQAGQPRMLLALDRLLQGTPYETYVKAYTMTEDSTQVYDERNLVILSRFPIMEHRQYKHVYAPKPYYQKVTATPSEAEAKEVTWERPILHARINLGDSRFLHVITLHLKSRIPSYINGQTLGSQNKQWWKTASGWAEGFFLSSMKRVGQALETRMLVDKLFDADEDALIVVCGDFNADLDEVPVEAIRGDAENTGNYDLAKRVLVPCENTIPETSRFSLYHRGKGEMIDHLLVSRNMLEYYRGAEIHNELLHDESVNFTDDKLFPESDHAPVIAIFEFPES